MHTKHAFTVIELLATSLLLLAIGVIGWTQVNHIQVAARDDKRRVAINSMYYSLEEVYYPQHQSYPKTIDEKILPSVDNNLFTDVNGVKLGDGKSDYRYEPTNCSDAGCKSYVLRADLEAESDYTKNSRNK